MRKISTTFVTLIATLSFVGAGTATAGDPCAGAKKAPVKKGGGNPCAGGNPCGTAAKKAPEQAAAPMEQPDPPAELAAAAKKMKGTWSCKGEDVDPATGASRPWKGTMKWKVDLDKFWLRGDLTGPKRKGEKRAMKMAMFRTYSAADSKWYQVGIGNSGESNRGWSTGPDAAGKVTWEVEMTMGGMTVKGRDYEEAGAKKNSVHMWGEVSLDGKNYMKVYDVTCTK